MFPVITTLLLATAASAQLTTSFWAQTFPWGTDKLGYYGSVINANSSHTTLAAVFDNGTDTSALGFSPQTYTYIIGENIYQVVAGNFPSPATPYPNGGGMFCTRKSPSDASAACTASYGPNQAFAVQCASRTLPASTSYTTRTFMYSGRETYSAGVETITQTFLYEPITKSRPGFCSSANGIRGSAYFTTYSLEMSSFGTFQVVITAGLEKLNATQGASASMSSALPTGALSPTGTLSGSAVSSTGSVAAVTGTGAAAPMVTVGPMIVGLGAGAAVAALVV